MQFKIKSKFSWSLLVLLKWITSKVAVLLLKLVCFLLFPPLWVRQQETWRVIWTLKIVHSNGLNECLYWKEEKKQLEYSLSLDFAVGEQADGSLISVKDDYSVFIMAFVKCLNKMSWPKVNATWTRVEIMCGLTRRWENGGQGSFGWTDGEDLRSNEKRKENECWNDLHAHDWEFIVVIVGSRLSVYMMSHTKRWFNCALFFKLLIQDIPPLKP